MQHRARRSHRRLLGLGAALLAAAGVAVAMVWPITVDRSEAPTAPQRPIRAPAKPWDLRPTVRPRPVYLTRSYRAPPELVRAGAGGSLQIPSLGVRVPVDAVGLDGTAMAVPDDPRRVGWLTRSARAGDLTGASVLAGHVSDREDRPGALFRLKDVRIGAVIRWRDDRNHEFRFRVVRVRMFALSRGLPASVFATDGPHVLNLVTCAQRVSTRDGGFHYRSNLVVTAVR